MIVEVVFSFSRQHCQILTIVKMPERASHRELRPSERPQSSRDLTLMTNQEIDQLRKSNATMKLSRCQAFRLFFWNGEERTVCYRTGTSWRKNFSCMRFVKISFFSVFITTFYPIFACFIIALFYAIMRLMIFCIKTYTKTPIVNKNSLTKEPSYF